MSGSGEPPPTLVVFDCETQDKIANMPGVDRTDQVSALEVSCLSYQILRSEEIAASPERAAAEADRAGVFTLWRDEDETNEGPFERMLKAFDDAELIVSYNGCGFDHLLLLKYYAGDHARYQEHMVKTHDIFARLREATGFWYKLDTLLKENGVPAKTSNGLQAITWWQDGERALLQEYCEGDVKNLTRLAVKTELKLPRTSFRAPNHVFGIASALASVRASAQLSA